MLRPVLPLFEYVINKDYIAEFLCVNQDNKELECNGKCYLMQRLAEENNEKKENLPRIAMEEYPIGFVNLLSVNNTYSKYTLLNTSRNYYRNQYSFMYSDTCFHPPNFM